MVDGLQADAVNAPQELSLVVDDGGVAALLQLVSEHEVRQLIRLHAPNASLTGTTAGGPFRRHITPC